MPVVAGGVEASLRRLAHYDYWSDKVRRAIILDAKADLVVYGMGERPLLEIVARLAAGQPIAPAARHSRHGLPPRGRANATPADGGGAARRRWPATRIVLPSYEEVCADKRAFVAMTRLIHRHSDPDGARRLVQYHGREAVVVNPPAGPLTEAEMDRVYGLPFTRRPHPSYGRQRIPAYEVVKDSIQILRGCFGGCTFCSLAVHQGRIIQSRSRQSVLDGDRPHGGRAGIFRRRQRPGRPDGQHVPDELHAGPRSVAVAAAQVASFPTIAPAGHGPRAARRADAVCAAARRREAGLRSLRRPHGLGPA